MLPKNRIREAMDYARNNSTALNQYVHHGHLATDNNAAERALRGIAIGRHNWLFLGSDRGGRPAAAHYSLIASCLRNNVEPFAYACSIAASEGGSPGCAGHPSGHPPTRSPTKVAMAGN